MKIEPNLKYELEVEADQNDADYVQRNSVISGRLLTLIMPLLLKIKAKRGAWEDPTDTYKEFTESIPQGGNILDIFESFIPCASDGMEIHTINSIKYCIAPDWTTIL